MIFKELDVWKSQNLLRETVEISPVIINQSRQIHFKARRSLLYCKVDPTVHVRLMSVIQIETNFEAIDGWALVWLQDLIQSASSRW